MSTTVTNAPDQRAALQDRSGSHDVAVPAEEYRVHPIAWVRSPLVDLAAAPRQGDEGAPDAQLVFADELQQGVFSTRSADRPNPVGLHRVEVTSIDDSNVTVRNLEVIDGTPIIDVKPTLGAASER